MHILWKTDYTRIKNRLKEIQDDLVENPLLLLSILVQERTLGTSVPARLNMMREVLYDLEQRLGTHKNYQRRSQFSKSGYYSTGKDVWERDGFDLASGELTSLASDCLLFESEININTNLLDFIHEMSSSYTEQRSRMKGSSTKHIHAALAEEIIYYKTALENTRHSCRHLWHRAQIQVQAVRESNLEPRAMLMLQSAGPSCPSETTQRTTIWPC